MAAGGDGGGGAGGGGGSGGKHIEGAANRQLGITAGLLPETPQHISPRFKGSGAFWGVGQRDFAVVQRQRDGGFRGF